MFGYGGAHSRRAHATYQRQSKLLNHSQQGRRHDDRQLAYVKTRHVVSTTCGLVQSPVACCGYYVPRATWVGVVLLSMMRWADGDNNEEARIGIGCLSIWNY